MNDVPSGLHIGAVMTKEPITVETSKSLADAAELMDKFSCRHLAVTEKDQLVGVISQRDLALAESVTKKNRSELTVDEAYVAFPYRADIADQLEKVLDEMLTLEIGSVLVLDGEKLEGILTTTDVIRILRDLLSDKPLR